MNTVVLSSTLLVIFFAIMIGVPLAHSNSVHHMTSNVSIKILQICLLQLKILFVNIVKL